VGRFVAKCSQNEAAGYVLTPRFQGGCAYSLRDARGAEAGRQPLAGLSPHRFALKRRAPWLT